MRHRCLALVLIAALPACDTQTAEPSPPASAVRPPPPPKAAHGPELGIFARAKAETHAYTLGDELFVSSGSILYRLGERGLIQPVALTRGRELGADELALAGSFPDAALLETRSERSGSAVRALLRWQASESRWQAVEGVQADESLLGAAAFRGGAIVLVGSERGLRLMALADRKLELAPKPASGGECTTELRGSRSLRALAAFESGHVAIAGTRCDAEQSWAVERFGPGATTSVIDPLPRVGGTERPRFALFGPSWDRLHCLVEDDGVLLSFDGRAWKRELLPVTGRVESAAVSSQGTLWLVVAGGLLRRRSGGSFERVAIADDRGAPLLAREVAAASDSRVLVVAKNRAGESVVALPGRRDRVVELPAPSGGSSAARQPASELCDRPFVLIASDVSPARTRYEGVTARLAFLEEIELVIERREGGHDLGLVTSSWDVAKRALALLKGTPEIRPELFCHAPRVQRRITIEKPEED